jgi:hypothetical protein
MAAVVTIKDSKDGVNARVTRFGQLVVAPLDYSTPVADNLDTINTAFNFIKPESGKNIVITDIIVSADKSVSATDPAEIEIYEANAPDTLVAEATIVSPRLLRGRDLTLIGMNLLVPEGFWVNAKTNDNNVLVTIMFYRVPVENV